MQFNRKMPEPAEIKELYAIPEAVKAVKAERDKEIIKVFTGESDKFLLIIGPCSADKDEPVMDYVHRLADIQQQVKDKILIIPRIYTNKPRTTGEGYKGMVHQPDLTKNEDIFQGVIKVRQLHTRAIQETGLTCADEMLYPENYRYISDLLSYVAVGARSVEDQQHRLTASGMDVPAGMKNPTSGDISVMLNSIKAAQAKHTFLYGGWDVTTDGNPYAHAILRGATNKHGQNISNYHYEDLIMLHEAYCEKNLKNMAVIVDTNHSNSSKKYLEQIRISKEVLHSMRHSEDIKNFVKGLMIESYIEDGCQSVDGGVYGKSITDPCLGWEKTEKLILDIAELL
ncbi:MAG: 3-deoxy-7-phosphoheptulonate synthase [Ruminococcus sp.]|nr:3-deoxy-7-phosphoheptulonate synthase [Ruminococcus sp.]MBQ7008593.1 3-deoxy-7-phosphoheptulonate synthase [Ruminococcus sp.]MBR6646039.1 3-deoxy-7-phosphoheptulonate synthase [Clostridia bacterium]